MSEEFGINYFYGANNSNYLNYEKMNHSKVFKGIKYFVMKHKIKGDKLLDTGCAFGFLLRELAPFFNNLSGLDISKFAIKKAKRIIPKANLNVLSLDEPLPYPDYYFDCITAVDILEHTKDFEKNLGKLVKKLRKGGYLIISTPINEWPRKWFGMIGDWDKSHVFIPKEKELFRIVKKNNLTIVEKKYFCPFPIIYRISNIPWQIEILLKKN